MPESDFASLQFPPGVSCPSNVLIHGLAVRELTDIVQQNPAARVQLKAKLNARLSFLSQNLGREIMHLEWFEPLKNSSYRSMSFAHVKLLNNLRIIYCIAHEKAYLLVAFKEHNSGDYTRALGIAKNRADQIG